MISILCQCVNNIVPYLRIIVRRARSWNALICMWHYPHAEALPHHTFHQPGFQHVCMCFYPCNMRTFDRNESELYIRHLLTESSRGVEAAHCGVGGEGLAVGSKSLAQVTPLLLLGMNSQRKEGRNGQLHAATKKTPTLVEHFFCRSWVCRVSLAGASKTR